MAYDEVLAERAREVLAAEADVTEKKMFDRSLALARAMPPRRR